MKTPLISFAFAAVAVAAAPAQADTITQWNFNSVTPDGNTGTGTTSPSTGVGVASLLSGVTFGYNSGNGSSDPVTVDDSGWQTSTYAAQGTGNKTRGVQFSVSTVGMEDIKFSFDVRHSNTSSRYEQVQYTLNGTTFVDVAVFDANLGGDLWYARSVDLSAVTGADNNANFGLRVVSVFAPSTSTYAPSTTTSNYGVAGTWRFDMATVSGSVITPVPEPESYALMLAGLVTVGLIARRRRSA